MRRLFCLHRNLLAGTSGVAALEFAIVAPALLMVLGGLVDFGLALNDSMQIQQAAQAGASYAFAAQQEAGVSSQISASAVRAAVQASLALSPAPTVTVTGPEAECTQTNSSASPPTTTLTSGTYGTACANGNPVGTYLVITVAYTFQPLMPFYSKLTSTESDSNIDREAVPDAGTLPVRPDERRGSPSRGANRRRPLPQGGRGEQGPKRDNIGGIRPGCRGIPGVACRRVAGGPAVLDQQRAAGHRRADGALRRFGVVCRSGLLRCRACRTVDSGGSGEGFRCDGVFGGEFGVPWRGRRIQQVHHGDDQLGALERGLDCPVGRCAAEGFGVLSESFLVSTFYESPGGCRSSSFSKGSHREPRRTHGEPPRIRNAADDP